MSSVKMGRRGGKQPKQVKGAEVIWHCLIPLLQTTPPPLQFPRLFRNGPASATRVSTIHVTTEATMAATVDAVTFRQQQQETPQSLEQRMVIF
jgi:hypothetical protein